MVRPRTSTRVSPSRPGPTSTIRPSSHGHVADRKLRRAVEQPAAAEDHPRHVASCRSPAAARARSAGASMSSRQTPSGSHERQTASPTITGRRARSTPRRLRSGPARRSPTIAPAGPVRTTNGRGRQSSPSARTAASASQRPGEAGEQGGRHRGGVAGHDQQRAITTAGADGVEGRGQAGQRPQVGRAVPDDLDRHGQAGRSGRRRPGPGPPSLARSRPRPTAMAWCSSGRPASSTASLSAPKRRARPPASTRPMVSGSSGVRTSPPAADHAYAVTAARGGPAGTAAGPAA